MIDIDAALKELKKNPSFNPMFELNKPECKKYYEEVLENVKAVTQKNQAAKPFLSMKKPIDYGPEVSYDNNGIIYCGTSGTSGTSGWGSFPSTDSATFGGFGTEGAMSG